MWRDSHGVFNISFVLDEFRYCRLLLGFGGSSLEDWVCTLGCWYIPRNACFRLIDCVFEDDSEGAIFPPSEEKI